MTLEHAPRPRDAHLRGWKTDGEAETAALRVRELIEHPGWSILLDSLQEWQRFEQLQLMREPAGDPTIYERRLGEMNGLELLPSLAAGVVENGRKAAERLRDVG